MAYLFLDDGGPDAADYSSNYFTFNESDPQVLERLTQVLPGKNQTDPEVIQQVKSICQASFLYKKNANSSYSKIIKQLQNISNRFRRWYSIVGKPEFTSFFNSA